MDQKKTSSQQDAAKPPSRLRDVSKAITNMLTEPEPEVYVPPVADPVPPELVADAVGWAPSMPPGPLLVDLAAHDPHKNKVPFSEAVTQPPMRVNPPLKPPSNLVENTPEPPKRKLKSQVVVIAAAFVGAMTVVFGLAILVWLISVTA
jgi:hypothetical protein